MANRIEFNAMKQDAIRRVREMERRSENYIRVNENPPPSQQPQPQPKQPQTGGDFHQPKQSQQQQQQQRPQQNQPQNPFSQILPQLGLEGLGIKIDQDKIILIALAIILLKNGADFKLLLALGYLLL